MGPYTPPQSTSFAVADLARLLKTLPPPGKGYRIAVERLIKEQQRGGRVAYSRAPRKGSSRTGGYSIRLSAQRRAWRSASSARLNSRSRCIVFHT